ncbi:hypothetical protein RvY_15365 [Ramazzottius varieornatus]|uniref:Uncharacterized protein n=1 Tax=Ramazzottius varieornatus TaxID=947166 RepID=A0A1D1VUN5_RAMVA|nr:hypothetical protein RvY_15365 [Ramazzottius varieornatus]
MGADRSKADREVPYGTSDASNWAGSSLETRTPCALNLHPGSSSKSSNNAIASNHVNGGQVLLAQRENSKEGPEVPVFEEPADSAIWAASPITRMDSPVA